MSKAYWEQIRKLMNATIDTCEKLDEIGVCSWWERQARSSFQEDVPVGDFLARLHMFPEIQHRVIIQKRGLLKNETFRKNCMHPQGIHQELAKTIQNVALVCTELVGLSEEELEKQFTDFEPPCGKKGTSIKDQVDAIIDIHAGWMTTGIKKALEKYRENPDPEDEWTKAKWKKE